MEKREELERRLNQLKETLKITKRGCMIKLRIEEIEKELENYKNTKNN
jgi:hypothetical protein